MIIYKTTNLINGKFYIGKDCSNNSNYLGSGKILKRAINKYGRKNFKKETLEICDLSNINERETYWIKKLKSQKIGYNICPGGQGWKKGMKHTRYSKNKISKSKMGHKTSDKVKAILNRTGVQHTEETKKKISTNSAKFWLGKHHTDSVKTKISITLKNSKKHPWRGKHLSEETKRKLSLSHLGKQHTEETKRKLSLNHKGKITWMKGKHHTEESKLKNSLSCKAAWAEKKRLGL